MDELFGDVLGRTGLAPRRRGFSPSGRRLLLRATRRARWSRPSWRASTGDAGPGDRGRELVVSGQRHPAERARAASTSSSRSSTARSAARSTLGADVVPTRHARCTRTACCASSCRSRRARAPRPQRCRSTSPRRASSDRGRRGGAEPREIEVAAPAAAARGAAGAAAARDRRLPRDTLMPLAVGQERSVQLVNDALGGNRMLVMVATRDPEARDPRPGASSTTSASSASIARMLRAPDGSLRMLVQAAQRVKHRRVGARGALPVRPGLRAARRGGGDARADRADAQRADDVRGRSSSRSPTCPRSSSSRWPTSTTPAPSRT